MGVADHGTAGQTTAAPSLAAWATSVAAALDNSDTTVNTRIAAHEADTTGIHGIADTAALVTTADSRLSDARTPTAHASSHAAAGSDPVTVAQSQVTNLAADLAAKAPLASPTLTGVPAAPTAAADTATTQLATTAFVVAQAATTTPLMDDGAAAGTSTRFARADHVHPSDTTRAQWSVVGNLVSAAQSTPAVGSLALSGCTEASGLVLTASGSGAFTASVSGVAVVVGQVYTVSAILAPSGRAVATRISWRNAGGSEISAVAGDSVAAGASAITSMATGVAPAGAVTMIAYAAYASTGSAGDAVTVTKFGAWAGAGGSWAAPGTPIANLGRRVTHPNTDDVLVRVWDGDAGRWQTAHYDSGVRDMATSLVNSWAMSTGSFSVRRLGSAVFLRAALNGAPATAATAMSALPAGFRPVLGHQFPVPINGSISRGAVAEVAVSGNVVIWAGNGAAGIQYLNLSFATSDTIPTALPGTLVSSAPA